MSANSGSPLVKVRDLRKSFGQNQVLRGVDLNVERGEVVSVIGASGSGKTTMLRCVNLLETYDAGSIMVDGVEVGCFARTSTARGCWRGQPWPKLDFRGMQRPPIGDRRATFRGPVSLFERK